MHTKAPFFSIIIPLYNKETYIEATLNSLLNQEFKDFEVLIVNDGSTDKSEEVTLNLIKDDIRFQLIPQDNKGVSTARNKGIHLAKGKYITFLDADDYWYPNHLMNFKKGIDKLPNKKVFCNNYKIEIFPNIFKNTQFTYFPYIDKKDIYVIDNYFKCSLKNSIAWTSSVCIESSISKLFLFDEKMRSGQDTDLWIRLGLKYSFVFNTTITAIHKKYIENSLSKSNAVSDRILITQKYTKQEKQNLFLKKFIDHNRFSLLLIFKRRGEKHIVNTLINQLDSNNINAIQQLLVRLPRWMINFLFLIKKIVTKIGFKNKTIFSS